MTSPHAQTAEQIIQRWIAAMTEGGQRRFVWGSVYDRDDLVVCITAALDAETERCAKAVSGLSLITHSCLDHLQEFQENAVAAIRARRGTG